jgi:hypothetical protein
MENGRMEYEKYKTKGKNKGGEQWDQIKKRTIIIMRRLLVDSLGPTDVSRDTTVEGFQSPLFV